MTDDSSNVCFQGKVAFVSSYGMHQLHIFIFVLAVCHVIYCIVTYALGKTKVNYYYYLHIVVKTGSKLLLFVKDCIILLISATLDEKVEEVGRGDQDN